MPHYFVPKKEKQYYQLGDHIAVAEEKTHSPSLAI